MFGYTPSGTPTESNDKFLFIYLFFSISKECIDKRKKHTNMHRSYTKSTDHKHKHTRNGEYLFAILKKSIEEFAILNI